MHIRVRKLIGTVLLLVLVIVWALVAMAVAQFVLPSVGGWVAAIYYVAVGLGWLPLAMLLVSWMSRPDPEPPSTHTQEES